MCVCLCVYDNYVYDHFTDNIDIINTFHKLLIIMGWKVCMCDSNSSSFRRLE